MSGRLAAGPAADTIFALASGMGRSAIAVLRISGTDTAALLSGLCGALPTPRMANLRSLRDINETVLDRAIVLWLPGPGSYTGEDSGELHVHGSRAVLDAVTAALVQAGARPADPGEFTRRAVVNGKMDLLAAEAVADLIDSETALQRTQALRQLSGTHTAMLDGWTALLTRFLAWQEALIDFSDDNLPPEVEEEMLEGLRRLQGEVRDHAGSAERGERLRRGLVFAIVGEPNVGKSSLLNALIGREVAIVSPYPGTTRDLVTADVVLDGIPVLLVDTAGLREVIEPVEAEGIRRARERAASADYVIHVVAGHAMAATAHAEQNSSCRELRVVNKIDLLAAPDGVIGVSALTGAGLSELRARLAAIAGQLAHPGDHPALSGPRHVAALRDMENALAAAHARSEPELRAEELRLALMAIGRLTGAVDSDTVLDVVFRAFCIGK